ncbi:beta-galactosidase [Glycomyces sp. TRM65418]|uniref:beta-galactosidase n=1 Tax=Glycomyces sp. TRM65418 TaxID=2867006 RepID=UPI001CE65E01|nr:beta-galactosidase [Glycomyces sp. TRM65418]QZD57085.1 beta-galactosidase [Glycomyces sp. TRM65418]
MQTIRYGGDYNPEQWPEEIWHEDVRLMREAGVNLVSLGIFNWGIIEPAPGEYDWTGLDRIMGLLHENGIGVDLGTPTAAPPSWLRRAHPEIRLVDFEGRVLASGSRHGVCPSHPVYNEACASIVEQLAARYGKHPAVQMWHLHNEYGWANVDCYCEVSAAAFRGWLAEKYGDVDRLNDAWGTAFWGLVYRDFDQVEAPSLAPPGVNPALRLDWKRFSNDAHIANYKMQRAIIARHSEAPATTNFMVPNCKDMDYFRWSDTVDIVSNNHYLVAERDEHEIELSMSADLTRAVAGGPWMVMEHSTSAVNWQPRNIAKTPGEMRRNSLAHVARGADGLMFFQWRASRAGAEKFHSAMLPHGGTDTDVWRDVVALGGDLERLSSVVGSDVAADVAILWDWESWWALELEWRPSVDLEFRERVEAYYTSLWKQHVTVDFAHPESDLGRYKAVVAPSSYLLTATAAKHLHGYVESGGHLLVSYFSGIVDEHDAVHPGEHASVLRETLGLWVEEFHPVHEGTRLALDAAAESRWRSGPVSGRIWSEHVRLDGAEAVAAFTDGPDAGRPAVTRHRVGAGTAWYVATALDDATGLRGLLAEVLDAAGVERPTGLPDRLEVVRRGPFRFLINHTDQEQFVPDLRGADALTGVAYDRGVPVPAGAVVVLAHAGS